MKEIELPRLTETQLMESITEGVRRAFDGAIRNATDMPTADIMEEIRSGVRDAFTGRRTPRPDAVPAPEPSLPGTWGPWVFVAGNLTLVGCGCEIDLEEIHSAAAVLDWVFQVAGKEWATPVVLAHLIQAFTDVLDPQANFCPFGVDTPASGAALALRYAEQLRAKAS